MRRAILIVALLVGAGVVAAPHVHLHMPDGKLAIGFVGVCLLIALTAPVAHCCCEDDG